ncbi:DUF397 domain-containing protein [Actinomadura sp. DC4]
MADGRCGGDAKATRASRKSTYSGAQEGDCVEVAVTESDHRA